MDGDEASQIIKEDRWPYLVKERKRNKAYISATQDRLGFQPGLEIFLQLPLQLRVLLKHRGREIHIKKKNPNLARSSIIPQYDCLRTRRRPLANSEGF